MVSISKFIYIDSKYCHSLGDFKECLGNMFLGKNINQEMSNLKYWLEPLILDGVLQSWLVNLNDNEANAIIDALNNTENRKIQSIIHRILMAFNIE